MNTDQIQSVIRFKSIFMPNMMDRITKRMSGRFAHYTSAANALNILRNNEIWMRNPRIMSDYMEVWHGHQKLLGFFQKDDNKNRNTFFAAVEQVAPGAAKKAFDLFDSWWGDIQFNTYISCVSEGNYIRD